jgi:hypothetical protein
MPLTVRPRNAAYAPIVLLNRGFRVITLVHFLWFVTHMGGFVEEEIDQALLASKWGVGWVGWSPKDSTWGNLVRVGLPVAAGGASR